jgi:endonuclease V-like protein UPF0215 family
VGIDDAPLPSDPADPVPIVGAVFAGLRLEGVLVSSVTRDGFDATEAIIRAVSRSRFREHVRLVLLQGITVGGFNVVDGIALHRELGVPVVVVSRREPDMTAVRRALLSHIPEGRDKWEVIRRLGPMEPCAGVYVQRVGIGGEAAESVVRRLSAHSRLPEPLRVAHLIAGALAYGESRGRV